MKIDPNQPIESRSECVLCEAGHVVLYDETSTSQAQLSSDSSAFKKFCRSLDPNKCFISGIIPNDADRPVFFRAREVANEVGIHMQALVDTPEALRTQWESYQKMKSYSSPEEED